MKPFMIRLALALSLLFNVFFAAGYVSTLRKLEQAEPATDVEVVSSELGLTGTQQTHFDALRNEFRSERASHREAMGVLRQLEAQELAVDVPDQATLDEIRARRSELQRGHRAAGRRLFDEFMNTLTPEQRRRIGERMRRGGERRDRGDRGDRGGRRGRGDRGASRDEVLRNFDSNGDGRLDEAEQLAFQEAMQRRKEDHVRRQQAWEETKQRLERLALEKFDADGNGELDDDERARAWDWKRRQVCEERREGARRPRGGERGRGGRDGPPLGGERRGEDGDATLDRGAVDARSGEADA